MTLAFVPGEPSPEPYSISQAIWRAFHIIAYCSGNNLIIFTEKSAFKNLQTIYFDSDATSVQIHPTKGILAVTVGSRVQIYQPDSEYALRPRWIEKTSIVYGNSSPNIAVWAADDDELLVTYLDQLRLYHVASEYGEVHTRVRWSMSLPNVCNYAAITTNGLKIAVCANYDRLVKCWSRVAYGESTRYILTYLEHTDIVTQFCFKSTERLRKSLDKSMTKIQNMRGFLEPESDNDILYTYTRDGILRLWSLDMNGRSSIRLCFEKSVGPLALFLVVDGSDVSEISTASEPMKDLLLAAKQDGSVEIYRICTEIPGLPNSASLIRIKECHLEQNCWPYLSTSKYPELSPDIITTTSFIASYITPIVAPEVVKLPTGALSILVHDRVKHTIRCNQVNLMTSEQDDHFGAILVNKFCGHTKTIRKLRKSTTKDNHKTVLLSISDFPEHNYIWEPISLEKGVTLAKRFRLDLSEAPHHENLALGPHILDAVIVNDVVLTNTNRRHHRVATIESSGYISLWDCNGSTRDDQAADLINRLPIKDLNGSLMTSIPRAFVLTQGTGTKSKASNTNELKSKLDSNFIAIAIYEDDCKAWELQKDGLKEFKVDHLPENFHLIAEIDLYANELNVLSAIDEKGVLRIFSVENDGTTLHWKQSSSLRTNISKAAGLHGATFVHKMAIVDESGLKLSIWDTKLGLLEYQEEFEDPVLDLDWTKVHDDYSQFANLSVGFRHHVYLYTQLRYDYTNKVNAYGKFKKLDVLDYTSHNIGDLIWTSDQCFIIACGNQFFVDDKWVSIGQSSDSYIDSTIRQMVGETGKDVQLTVLNVVKVLNGPLPLYHPQFLIQALFWGRVELVKDILVRLLTAIRSGKSIKWDLDLSYEKEVIDTTLESSVNNSGRSTPFEGKKNLSQLFEQPSLPSSGIETFLVFNSQLADLLNTKLTKLRLPLLTRHQQITLTSVITIVKIIHKYEGSMDSNGIKFLIGLRLMLLLSKQNKLLMRDINWAIHSDNKEVLLMVVEDLYHNKLTWKAMCDAGIPYWQEALKLVDIVEMVARNEFAKDREPSGIVLIFYLILRKKNVLIGLWKMSTGSEQQKMLKFLGNDFTDRRWRVAAQKNAFVLLSKHRYLDAATFFLLGDCLKDACSVLANKAEDVTLAILAAKVYQVTSKGDEPIVDTIPYVLENFLLEQAIQMGDRWTTSWIFWELRKSQLAVKALIESPSRVVRNNLDTFQNPERFSKIDMNMSLKAYFKDDPVLMVLFNDLRHRNVKYLEGAIEISKQEEFDFVVKTCITYNRMGCDFLALMILKNWKFVEYDEEKGKINWGDNTGLSNKEKLALLLPTVSASTGRENDPITSFEDDNLGYNATKQSNLQAPPEEAFAEPDMSSFDFGF